MKLTLLITLLTTAIFSSGQISSDKFLKEHGVDREHIFLMRIKPPDADVIGDYMLFNDWLTGDITVEEDRVIQNIPMNYNIVQDILYVRIEERFGEIKSDKVSKITLPTGDVYVRKVFEKPTFMRVIHSGSSFSLFEYTEVVEKEPDYVVALDIGSRDYKITKKTKLVIEGDSLGEVKKKKTREDIFGDSLKNIEEYAKSNKLDWNEKQDIIEILKYANTNL